MGKEIIVSDAVQQARKAVFDGLSQYRTPYSRELEGKSFEIFFEDGTQMMISFPMRSKVDYQLADGPRHINDGYVMKAADGAYFLMTEVAGSKPREGLMAVIDVFQNLATVVFTKQGTDPSFPKLVTREVKFGAMKDGEGNLPEKRAAYTHDLEGKKIDWTYNPEFAITHVYLKDNYYTIALNDEMKARMAEARANNPEAESRPRMNPYYEENCLYIKLRENLYLFSFVERNTGSGTQGMMIINTERVHDVGCFWGAGPTGENEAYMFSAYGKWIRDHLPEDDTLEKIGK